MSKFKVSTPIASDDKINDVKAEKFAQGHSNRSIDSDFDPDSRPTKSFTVPLNEYELSLLQAVAKIDDRSQRYMARKLLRNALIEALS